MKRAIEKEALDFAIERRWASYVNATDTCWHGHREEWLILRSQNNQPLFFVTRRRELWMRLADMLSTSWRSRPCIAFRGGLSLRGMLSWRSRGSRGDWVASVHKIFCHVHHAEQARSVLEHVPFAGCVEATWSWKRAWLVCLSGCISPVDKYASSAELGPFLGASCRNVTSTLPVDAQFAAGFRRV
jgi:hypothetical protein